MSLIFRMIAAIFFLHAWKENNPVFCTIDVNLSELEYLAGHLDPSECRRLVAALHYTTFELPESIAGAERKLDENIPCIRLLLHWNSSPGEGRGQTHEDIEHRLRQLNRNDLADWLGKTTFKELGRDLNRALNHPFGEQGTQDTDAPSPATLEPGDEPPEEDPWLPVDTLLFATMAILLAALITVSLGLIIHRLRLRSYENNNYTFVDQEEGNDVMTGMDRKRKPETKKKIKGVATLRKSKDNSENVNLLSEPKKLGNGCCGTACVLL